MPGTDLYEIVAHALPAHGTQPTLASDGRAMLVVTHDAGEAAELAAHVARQGLATGPVRTLGGPPRFWAAPDESFLPSEPLPASPPEVGASLERLRVEGLELQDDCFHFSTVGARPDPVVLRTVRELGWHVGYLETGDTEPDQGEPPEIDYAVFPAPRLNARMLCGMTGLPRCYLAPTNARPCRSRMGPCYAVSRECSPARCARSCSRAGATSFRLKTGAIIRGSRRSTTGARPCHI